MNSMNKKCKPVILSMLISIMLLFNGCSNMKEANGYYQSIRIGNKFYYIYKIP